MGVCKYCSTSAGMFRDEHPVCFKRAEDEKASTLTSITETMKQAIVDGRISGEVSRLFRIGKTEADIKSPTLTALMSELQGKLNRLIKDVGNDKKAVFDAILTGWSEAALHRATTEPPLDPAERDGIVRIIFALDLPASFSGIALTMSGVNLNGPFCRSLPNTAMGVLAKIANSEGSMAVDFSNLVWMVRTDKYSSDPNVIAPCPFVLKEKNEHAIWIGRCELMQEVTTSQYVGEYGGASVRLASGLWWRVGGSKSHKEVYSSIQPRDEMGDFAITTHAVYFGGKRCTFRIPLSSVVKINSYTDAVGVCKDGGKEQIFLTITKGLAHYVFNLLEEITKIHERHERLANSPIQTFKLEI
jgi:hypothetical protein